MKRNKVSALLLVLVLLAALSVPAFAAADISAPDYVVDDAGVLSPTLEAQIRDTNAHLEADCRGAQFVVVTVKYTPSGMDREEYATELFDTWNIGDAVENNGFLLLLCTEEDDFWLEAGYGVYNHPAVDEIAALVDDNSRFYKNIRKDKDEEAVSALLEGIAAWCETNYGGGTVSSGYEQGAQSGNSGASTLLFLLVVILILVIITSPRRTRRRYGRVGIWPFFYWTSWYRAIPRADRWRMRRTPPPPPSPHNTGFRAPMQHNPPPRGGSSFHSGGSSFRSGFGGFGGGHSGGFHGGGGHSGGGFGHR